MGSEVTLQFIDDLERIREAHAKGERFIVVFSVEDSSKIEQLGEFAGEMYGEKDAIVWVEEDVKRVFS